MSQIQRYTRNSSGAIYVYNPNPSREYYYAILDALLDMAETGELG